MGEVREPRRTDEEARLAETQAGPAVDVRVTMPLKSGRPDDAGAAHHARGALEGTAETQLLAVGQAMLDARGAGPDAQAKREMQRLAGSGRRVEEAGSADTQLSAVGRAARVEEAGSADTQLLAVGRAEEAGSADTQLLVVGEDAGSADTQLLAVGLAAAQADDAGSADTQLLAVGRAARVEDAGSADTQLLAVGLAAARVEAAGSADPQLLAVGRAGAQVEPRGARVSETRVRRDVKFSEPRGRSTDETRVHSGARFSEETRVRTDVGFGGSEPEEVVVPVGGEIGRFMVLRELGRGAMGVVFAAYDEELDRKVAIKLLHAGRGADASLGRTMLVREAQAMARLSHPNVVAVHEVGVFEGAVFVAMEYVAGVDLQTWLAAAQRPAREVVAVLRQAGAGLVAAHAEGLVHRDFKPSNVLVGDDGRVRVADFGLATRRSEGGGVAAAGTGLNATLTGEGALVGTPLYMAPELLRGGAATAASDQYAFCVALYEALYGERPFTADDLASLTDVVGRQALPATPPRVGVPEWLHAAVTRGLAKLPADRWTSMAELVELLGRDPEAERQQRRRRALQIAGAIAATAAVVTLLVLAYGALRRVMAERQAEGRLVALREQMTALQERGDSEEAGRLLRTFVSLPENRGTSVIAGAYREWAAAQADHAAAVDAYASAYIAARRPADAAAALRGLIDRLSARGQVKEASAALTVLERTAPDEAAAPELQAVRLAAALARRDIRAARVVLAGGDPGGWSAVLEDLAHVTELPQGKFGVDFSTAPLDQGHLTAVDHDGDGTVEVVEWAGGARVRVFRREPGLAELRTFDIGGPVKWVHTLEPLVPGEPLIVASYREPEATMAELRVMVADADGRVRVAERWMDGLAIHATTVDFDGDGARELYVASEAYARKFWRVERAADGTWSRRSAHPPTDAVVSDLVDVRAVDFEGDGRQELVVLAGPWGAYDVRVYKPTAKGELDLMARRAFGSFEGAARVRAGDRDVLIFNKMDLQIAPGRFPADRPLGEPAGLYVVGLGAGGVEVLGHLPTEPANGRPMKIYRVHAGDLDGDGDDEVVVNVPDLGMGLLRWRAGEPLQMHLLPGLRPLLVTDLDGDGTAEIVAAMTGQGRVLVLGAGTDALPLVPPDEAELRPVPPGISDPVVATAWANAEQLVAIGLPQRTAAELAAIAGFAGPVAPDMLYRTGELYAQIGEDARAAEQFVAAASRADLAPAALAGAAQARERLGEFAEAEALTRRRLALVPADERAAVETELAALTAAAASRPELRLDFARPLDGRWRVHDPVALRRGLGSKELSVWASPGGVAAEFPLVWDGGPAALEVELAPGQIEWGAEVVVEVVGPDDLSWLEMSVGGFGVTDAPVVQLNLYEGGAHHRTHSVKTSRVRARLAVYPGFAAAIHEVTADGATERRVGEARAEKRPAPPAGPLRLRVRSKLIESGFVGHVGIREIRLTGFTAGETDAPPDETVRRLVEGDFAGAAALLATAPADSVQTVWRIEALLGLGQLAAAEQAMAALVAAAPDDSPAFAALYQRLRREEPLALLAARGAFGARFIEVLLQSRRLSIRPGDVEAVLALVPATTTEVASPDEPEALERLVLAEYARGMAHEYAGQLAAARTAYAAAFARLVADRPFPLRDQLRRRLIAQQQTIAVALGDREEALRWVRMRVDESATPYLVLERLQSDPALSGLLGADTWATLLAEVRASRP
jgi:tRNA A-37 threonylcarbamoyl transferase component Bud32/tetratricopeptide (TPR) repeat protein